MNGDAARVDDYLPISAYALIGDCHTAALVSTTGSIDWYCPGRFDAPAVFCRILDAHRGGSFRVCPSGRFSSERRYRGATNVLETTFITDTGRVRLVDLMPIHPRKSGRRGYDVGTERRILRLLEGVGGSVEMEVSFRTTFDYARGVTEVDIVPGEGLVARAGDRSLALSAPGVRFETEPGGTLRGAFRLRAGERLAMALTDVDPEGDGRAALAPPDAAEELARTLRYWEEWSAACTYHGPYRPEVLRSALALKLLDYEPSGALVAAPTASLPEEIGGVRNWDYRYSWLRDSALILDALHLIGYGEEAMDFFDWMGELGIRRGGDLRIMYRVDGGSGLEEHLLPHLEGYRGSRPVRIGNAAADQVQLDVYGEVLDAAYLCHTQMDHRVGEALWPLLRMLADHAAGRWREPDWGIWEVRGGPRHFLYSKLLCWVALDRALRLAERDRLPADLSLWRRERDAIRHAILDDGYDARLGAFTQALGEEVPVLDASVLAIPLVGFLPATDPRVRSTVQRIRRDLTSDGLVYRYLAEDGLPGGEATFALCSFWMVDNLALAGRLDEARDLFERLCGYANDVGLLAEEIDPVSGELVGNFPQGFTHLALIRSALHIATAEREGAEETPKGRAERSAETERAAGGRARARGRTALPSGPDRSRRRTSRVPTRVGARARREPAP